MKKIFFLLSFILWSVHPLSAQETKGTVRGEFEVPFYDSKNPNRLLSLIRGSQIRVLSQGQLQLGKVQVIVFDPYICEEEAREYGVVLTSFDKLLQDADFISLHVPLTKSTYKLLGEEEFKKMKNTAYVINTSRGAVVDTEALAKAVRENWIAGAGLDVLPQEPPDINDPLLSQENIVLTPHAAFCSVESLLDLQRTAANQVACVLQGKKPEYIVNPEVLDNPKLRASLKI